MEYGSVLGYLLKGKKGSVMPIVGQWALDTSFKLPKKS
jgi:hypothetical protein